MFPYLRVTEARLCSPMDLHLPFVGGDRRVPTNHGPHNPNYRVPLQTYGRTGKCPDNQPFYGQI